MRRVEREGCEREARGWICPTGIPASDSGLFGCTRAEPCSEREGGSAGVCDGVRRVEREGCEREARGWICPTGKPASDSGLFRVYTRSTFRRLTPTLTTGERVERLGSARAESPGAPPRRARRGRQGGFLGVKCRDYKVFIQKKKKYIIERPPTRQPPPSAAGQQRCRLRHLFGRALCYCAGLQPVRVSRTSPHLMADSVSTGVSLKNG